VSLRRIGGGLALAAAGTLSILILLELFLRFFAPQPLLHDPDAFVPDPVLGARLRPGFQDRAVTTEFASTWSINQGGYRGPAAGSRGAPARRIVAAGDSFTFGYGVEEEQAWPRRLERDLDGPGEAFTEVLNLGVGGYGTWQEALWLERLLPDLRPDLVVVAFYVGNDPEDNLRAVGSGAPGAASASPAGPPPRMESLKRWLGSRLHLYNLVSTRADELLVRTGLRKVVYPFEVEVLLEEEPSGVSDAWRSTRVALDRLAAACRASGAELLLVAVPMKHQVDDTVWRRVADYYARLEGVPATDLPIDRQRPQRRLEALAADAGIEMLDLAGPLREAQAKAATPNAFYWPRDQHWNAAGHAEAARIIADRIRRMPAWIRGTGSG